MESVAIKKIQKEMGCQSCCNGKQLKLFKYMNNEYMKLFKYINDE